MRGNSTLQTSPDVTSSVSEKFDLKSWQGLTEVLRAGKDGLSPEAYAEFRNLILQYAQHGGDAEYKKHINTIIASFGKKEQETSLVEPESLSINHEAKDEIVVAPHTVSAPLGMRRTSIPRFFVVDTVQTTPASVPTSEPVLPAEEASIQEVATPPASVEHLTNLVSNPVENSAVVVESELVIPVIPQPIPEDVANTITTPAPMESVPVAEPVAVVPSTPSTPEAPRVYATLEESKKRIAEIKRSINVHYGNPVALMAVPGNLGKTYMSALLAALKASGPGANVGVDEAMASLEIAFEALLTVSKVPEASPQPQEKVEVSEGESVAEQAPISVPAVVMADAVVETPVVIEESTIPEISMTSKVEESHSDTVVVHEPVPPVPTHDVLPQKEEPETEASPVSSAFSMKIASVVRTPAQILGLEDTNPNDVAEVAENEESQEILQDVAIPPEYDNKPSESDELPHTEEQTTREPETNIELPPLPPPSTTTSEAIEVKEHVFVAPHEKVPLSPRAEVMQSSFEKTDDTISAVLGKVQRSIKSLPEKSIAEMIQNKPSGYDNWSTEVDQTLNRDADDLTPKDPVTYRENKWTKKAIAPNSDIEGLKDTYGIDATAISVKQTELVSPENTAMLNKLLLEWSIFSGSGIFGIGPGGIEHPLYSQLSVLTMGEVIAGRWDNTNPKTLKIIKQYVDAWRHEQGITYTDNETFEHYLRRVVQRIQKRQNS